MEREGENRGFLRGERNMRIIFEQSGGWKPVKKEKKKKDFNQDILPVILGGGFGLLCGTAVSLCWIALI